jgi:hypothetical protein
VPRTVGLTAPGTTSRLRLLTGCPSCAGIRWQCRPQPDPIDRVGTDRDPPVSNGFRDLPFIYCG